MHRLHDAIRSVAIHDPAHAAAGQHLLAAVAAPTLAEAARHAEEARIALEPVIASALREAPGAALDLALVSDDLRAFRAHCLRCATR